MITMLYANPIEPILQNKDQRINVRVEENGVAINATALQLDVVDRSKTVLFTGALANARIINSSAGNYYMDWGDPTAAVNIPTQTETNTVQDLFAVWRIVATAGSEPAVLAQVVKVYDLLALAHLPYLRLALDKAVKLLDESQQIFLGYSDAQLLMFLEGGVNVINAWPPNPTSITIEGFPVSQRQLLIDAATYVALQSQWLYAIDTDIDNYSDQGYSFPISHAPKIQSFCQALWARLDKMLLPWKIDIAATRGSITMQAGNSYRLNEILQSAPSGLLFRGFLVS